MSSIRRINASRANGALSRGPVTPEGKARSAANATHHGLLAQAVVLDAEDAGAFQSLLDAFLLKFQPADPVEESLVEEMATSTWRLRRCWAIETRMVSDAASSCAGPGALASIGIAYSELAGRPGLPLLGRYETRANHIYQRALKSLLQIREKCRFPNEPNPISEHQINPLPTPDPEPQTAPPPPSEPEPEHPGPRLIPPIPLGPPVPLPDPTDDPFVRHLADLVYAGKVKLL